MTKPVTSLCLCLFVSLCLSLTFSTVNAEGLVFGTCPEGQGGTDCASTQLPLDPDHPDMANNVTAFVRRLYSGAAPTGKSLWMLEGGPGFSTNALVGAAEVLIQADPSLTAYLLDQRGTGLSDGLECFFQPPFNMNPDNSSLVDMFQQCNTEIVEKYADKLPFFTTYHGARDLQAVIDLVNPETVAFYALSYGTYHLNTYLQLPNARADVVVLDGPVPPNRWRLADNAAWVSEVAQSVLHQCAGHSATCANRLGVLGQIPRLVMDSVIDRTLPCLSKLPWLTQRVTSQYAAFMTADEAAHVLQGPFWARLYRCSSTDVQDLNVFHAAQEASSSVPHDYSYGLGMNIATNEVYSSAPDASAPTYDQQKLLTSRLFADASAELTVSLARSGGWPRYTPHPTTHTFAQPKVPVAVFVGTLDPNTPHGNGVWFKNGLGDAATLVTVPFSAHGTLAPGAVCVLDTMVTFLGSLGKVLNTTCMASIPVPDFEGTLASTQALSEHFFGTKALWGTA